MHTHTHLGTKLKNKDERDAIELECLVALERWDEASTKLSELIRENPDHWHNIYTYIKSQVHRSLILREKQRKKSLSDGGSTDERPPPIAAENDQQSTEHKDKEKEEASSNGVGGLNQSTDGSVQVGDSNGEGQLGEQHGDSTDERSAPAEDGSTKSENELVAR